MIGLPDTANAEHLLNNRVASLIGQNDQAMDACTEIAGAMFRFYALLRAERFTAAEAEHALNIFCSTTASTYAAGHIPGMEES